MGRLLQWIKHFFTKSGPPEDPYAYVGAPKKPRPPHRSAAARVDEPLD